MIFSLLHIYDNLISENMIILNNFCLSATLEHGTHHLLFAVCDLASPNSGISTLLNFQKLKLNFAPSTYTLLYFCNK